MPRFLDDDVDDSEYSVSVPGIYASLLPWAQWEFERGGDPRLRRDGERPPAAPSSWQANMLADLAAGKPVVVQAWIARGHRWLGQAWSEELFALPWDPKVVRHVEVHHDDTVVPHTMTRWRYGG